MTTFKWETHFEDTGCRLSASCLKCPLPQCVHDLPPGGAAAAKGLIERRRTVEAYTRHRQAHPAALVKDVLELTAAELGISKRAVSWRLAAAKAAGGAPCP